MQEANELLRLDTLWDKYISVRPAELNSSTPSTYTLRDAIEYEIENLDIEVNEFYNLLDKLETFAIQEINWQKKMGFI